MAIEDSPINRYPAGLLGLIDVKAMGKAPRNMAPSVNGVVDFDPFYRAENRIVKFFGQVGVVTVGLYVPGGLFSANNAVPDGQVWLVESILARTITAVPNGGLLRVAPAIVRANVGANELFWAGTPEQIGPASATRAVNGVISSYTFAKPLVMMPGMKLALSVVETEALGVGVDVDCLATVSPVSN